LPLNYRKRRSGWGGCVDTRPLRTKVAFSDEDMGIVHFALRFSVHFLRLGGAAASNQAGLTTNHAGQIGPVAGKTSPGGLEFYRDLLGVSPYSRGVLEPCMSANHCLMTARSGNLRQLEQSNLQP
jgi:hypothetical protein